MEFLNLHPWNVTLQEAKAIQNDLAAQVIRQNDLPAKSLGGSAEQFGGGEIQTIAGADIALKDCLENTTLPLTPSPRGSGKGEGQPSLGFAGVIVYSYPDLKEIEHASAIAPIEFPYIPGLLAFREGPILLKAFEKLKTKPDLVMFDGQGLAHPRRLGIASHLGLWLDLPTIGVAKKVLVGKYQEPDLSVGSQTPLMDKEKTIGICLRTRFKVKPIFVSVGHKIDLPTAVKITLSCLDGTRIPKPTREADRFVEQTKNKGL